MKKVIIESTADGSSTLFVPELDEHYHSINGAMQESRHVYIEAGFNQCMKPEIHVLEFGFGTGLNALLTALEAEKRKVKVFYTGLEKFPLPQEIVEKLNYPGTDRDLYPTIHQSEWAFPVQLTPFFNLCKIQTDFSDFDFPEFYDVVYYDAFAPDKQPEVWSQELFDKVFSSMNPGGMLTTYCAKGSVRRMMLQAGFCVERLPGPPGKREMLRVKTL
ncbi:MAG: tRNA (5-methylaminomethyl-2-thiouridine)(34)-methyltransferase MnmD [Candidatus Symbiothrix sp.]|jgi:tRNA U34 5-methylaminomethyl-2-thiouridine-forming methyltransferase MnmC|nr:tRNA (5-methylaminomethyl-2-thiouridine)(34)-methyltransferase MnmD [Candidatus Symbiothrix sp.]